VSPEQLLRTYFHAKDENRPHLLADVFASDARLEVNDRSGHLGFPGVTVGPDGIADVLVRRFNQAYENVHSYYLDRPPSAVAAFICDWLVAMTEKASRNVRVGCGRYEWTFAGHPDLRVIRLVITIEQMVEFAPAYATEVMRSLRLLDYPWTCADRVTSALSLDELGSVKRYFARHSVID
jgi:SnoaL-like domain